MECAMKATNTARNKWESICRPALLKNNAPDSELSELSDMSSSPLKSSNFWFLQNYNNRNIKNDEAMLTFKKSIFEQKS